MDRVHIGNTFRAIRLELHLRQADVGVRAGVSQQTVSKLECGRFGGLTVDAYCRIAEVLDADILLAPHWRGPKLDRLLDRRHALLQNRTVETLVEIGWEVYTEQSFNHFGDRGSVDVLGWRPDLRALLIVEIKSEITSLEETLRRIDVKARVYPKTARQERGWAPLMVGVALVLPDATTHRDLLRRHSALVSASLPARTLAVRRWVSGPVGDLRGVWFLRYTSGSGVMRRVELGRRVRAAHGRRCGKVASPIRPGASVDRDIVAADKLARGAG
ncbi:MAG: helix-turn-helix domain-containing protein [Candidatus Limnocylindrales bacterium]